MIDSNVLWQIALRVGALSLIAVGGVNALIPELHEQAVVATRWLTEANFSEAVGLAQAAPGPNMLLVPLIGWQAAGVAGAAVAFVAFLVPSSTIAIAGSRALARNAKNPWVESFKWALRPVTGGLMLSSAIVLVVAASRTFPYPSALTAGVFAAVALAVFALSLRFKLNPIVWLAAAALAGALM
jgi:chromate transporter